MWPHGHLVQIPIGNITGHLGNFQIQRSALKGTLGGIFGGITGEIDAEISEEISEEITAERNP